MVVKLMRNIRLIVAYDGTDLAGYQKQSADKGITVQGALEKALSIIVPSQFKSMEPLERMRECMLVFKCVPFEPQD